jgi:DNA-binding winged helix-turn-helix (wHTH) protein
MLMKNKKRLIMCLLNDINRKQDIIKVVWYENYKGISDNNYHQLIHKFRSLLTERNLPGSVIKTINRYGLRLDTSLLSSPESDSAEGKFYGYA